MGAYRHTKTNQCSKFAHFGILENFEEWVQIFKRSQHNYNEEVSKTELGQQRFSLTAFANALTDIHSETVVKTGETSACYRVAHDSLFIALRLCFELKMESQNTARKLISEIFYCERNLHSIFSVLSLGLCHVTKESPSMNIDSFTLYPRVSSSNFDQMVYPTFCYYLKSINPEILNGIIHKAIDINSFSTPLMAAATRRDPRLVLLLLRHGANPLHRLGVTGDNGDTFMQSPLAHIISSLNSYCTFMKYSCDCDNYFHAALDCFYEMLKSVCNVKISEAGLQWNQDDHINELPENCFTINSQLAKYIPINKFQGPSSLKQICRNSIRYHLLLCTSLRNSIEKTILTLPVPLVIKEFLNLN